MFFYIFMDKQTSAAGKKYIFFHYRMQAAARKNIVVVEDFSLIMGVAIVGKNLFIKV